MTLADNTRRPRCAHTNGVDDDDCDDTDAETAGDGRTSFAASKRSRPSAITTRRGTSPIGDNRANRYNDCDDDCNGIDNGGPDLDSQ